MTHLSERVVVLVTEERFRGVSARLVSRRPELKALRALTAYWLAGWRASSSASTSPGGSRSGASRRSTSRTSKPSCATQPLIPRRPAPPYRLRPGRAPRTRRRALCRRFPQEEKYRTEAIDAKLRDPEARFCAGLSAGRHILRAAGPPPRLTAPPDGAALAPGSSSRRSTRRSRRGRGTAASTARTGSPPPSRRGPPQSQQQRQ